MDYLDKSFTVPPSERNKPQNTATEVTTPAVENPATTEQPSAVPNQTAQAQSQTTETVKPDEFFENFNKRYSTAFKTDDEVRNVLGMPQKIGELETKAKLTDDYAKKIETYESQIEELRNTGNSEFLQKPLIRKAYVAEQLLAKYPDKDPFTLQEIVMADVDKMSDIDALVKVQKINHPRLAEADIKAVIFKKHGIDPEMKPEEWDSIARAEIAMDAEDARANIKALTNGIELPKTVTKEERLAQESKNLQERTLKTEPLKADFLKFDKFKLGDFEYDPTADFKNKLPDMFDAFFETGQEPTQENLNAVKELRDAMFLYQHFDKIKEVIAKSAQTEVQKKLDEALHNTTPPNTATATDDGGQQNTRPGLGKLLEDMSK